MSDADEPTAEYTNVDDLEELKVPSTGGQFHGPMFVGRRRSDRWLTYLTMTLMIAMFCFVTYTSYQQGQSAQRAGEAAAQRNEIIDTLRKQQEQVLCFADTTQAFELAISNLLLASQGDPSDPATRQAIVELRQVQAALLEAKRLCFTPDPSSPTTTLVPTPGTLPEIPPTTGPPNTNETSAPTLIPPPPSPPSSDEPEPTTTGASPAPTESPPPDTPPPSEPEATTTTVVDTTTLGTDP